MQYTPIYRLPFAEVGENISSVMERTRYMAIDRQLEALFTFLGDGVISGWDITSSLENPESILVSPGAGVVLKSAVATSAVSEFTLENDVSKAQTINYVYIRSLKQTPHTVVGEMFVSTILHTDPSHLLLGRIIVQSNWGIAIDVSPESSRTQLTLLRHLLESVSKHVHTGAPSEPSKIDLFNHVKGILSAANIEDLPASKITSGVFDKDRFSMSHKDLEDIGTLTHPEIDALIEKFQAVNALLFGDMMTANLIQLVLSLKHVWEDVDDYFYNSFAVIPGIGRNTFGNINSAIDVNATTAEIDYLNHRIRGKFVPSKEIGQYVINSVAEFKANGINPGLPTYDDRYVTIGSTVSVFGDQAYGYGYGAGSGIDYFDVLEAVSGGSDLVYGVTGLLTGTGLTEVDGTPDWEATYSGTYGFGYGYEDLPIFQDTLFSTSITLLPTSSSLNLHEKTIENYLAGDQYIRPLGSMSSTWDDDGTGDNDPDLFRFLFQMADHAGPTGNRATDIRTGETNTDDFKAFDSAFLISPDGGGSQKLRSNRAAMFLVWDDPLDMTTDNFMHVELSQVLYRQKTNDDTVLTGMVGYEDIENNTAFTFKNSFDRYWAPDVGQDLIIEVTRQYDPGNGLKTYRHFYKYFDSDAPGVSSHADYRFLDVTDNTIFQNLEQAASDTLPAKVRLPVNMKWENLHEIKHSSQSTFGGYEVPTTGGSVSVASYETYYLTNPSDINYPYVGLEPNSVNESTILGNITGVYFHTVNDFNNATTGDYRFSYEEDADVMLWPQGQKFTRGIPTSGGGIREEWDSRYMKYKTDTARNLPTMKEDYDETHADSRAKHSEKKIMDFNGIISDKGDSLYRESKMLVDIDKIFIGGSPGFRYHEELNTVEDIVVNFPTAVDFNSMSWISSEPSDSIVYLQIKRLATSAGEEGEENYNSTDIYVKAGSKDDLEASQVLANTSLRPDRDNPWLGDDVDYKPSGSGFPAGYQGIRSIAIRAVLLPSVDKRIAPTLNSITINYTSNTESGDLTITSRNQWASAVSSENIIPKTETIDQGLLTETSTDFVTLDTPTSESTSGKVKNLLYGTLGAIVEHGGTASSWGAVVKRYAGDGSDGTTALPATLFQTLVSSGAVGIDGYVTHIKKQQTGDIVILDQYVNSNSVIKETSGSRIIFLDKKYNLKRMVISEPALKGSSSTDATGADATLWNCTYNPDLGDYGALYLVFTHELEAYQQMYNIDVSSSGVETVNGGQWNYAPQTTIPDGETGSRNKTVDLSKMSISFKGITIPFTGNITEVIPCGRGTLCLLISKDIHNLVESLAQPEIRVKFKSVFEDPINVMQSATSGSCVSFLNEDAENPILGTTGTVVVPIAKPSYDVIYAPIEGAVAFDIDEDGQIYVLKETNPNGDVDGDFYPAEPWYVSFGSKTYWQGWDESTGAIQSTKSSVFPITDFREAGWTPDFYLNSIYGRRGCIQKQGNFLLITVSGDKRTVPSVSGILLFHKDSDGDYEIPNDPYFIPESGLYPMAARFEKIGLDLVSDSYGDVYIALSDLKISTGGVDGKSKVIRVDETAATKVVWEWGAEETFNAGIAGTKEFSITVNDVMPLSYKKDGITLMSSDDDIEVVIST